MTGWTGCTRTFGVEGEGERGSGWAGEVVDGGVEGRGVCGRSGTCWRSCGRAVDVMSVMVALIDEQCALWNRDEAGSGYGWDHVFGRQAEEGSRIVS